MFGYFGGAIVISTSIDNQDEEQSIGLFNLEGSKIQLFDNKQKRQLRQKTHQAIQNSHPIVLDSLLRIEKQLENIDEFIFWKRYGGENSQQRLDFLFEIQGIDSSQNNKKQRYLTTLKLHLLNPFIAHDDPKFCLLCREKIQQLQHPSTTYLALDSLTKEAIACQ
jgi:hypothetical protein